MRQASVQSDASGAGQDTSDMVQQTSAEDDIADCQSQS